MRNLFNFILRNSHWLVAILLIAFSFYLIFANNSYQQSVYLTSANRVTGWFYTTTNNVSSFFLLKKNNELLLARNAELEKRYYGLQSLMEKLTTTDSLEVKAFVAEIGRAHV